jgi:hypothetical protein
VIRLARKAGPGLALGAAVLLCAAGALSEGEVARAAARGAAAVALLAAVGVLVRARRTAFPPAAAQLTLAERQPLAKGSGVVVVTAGGRRLLVGYGPGGVTLLAELTGDGRPAP